MCLREILSSASNGASSLESQTDTVTEENESTPTVTVSWEKKNEEGESDGIKKETDGGEEMIVKETAGKNVSSS